MGALTLCHQTHRVRIGKITLKRKCSSRFNHEFNVTTNALIAGLKAKGGK